jgi:hypothetical protein
MLESKRRSTNCSDGATFRRTKHCFCKHERRGRRRSSCPTSSAAAATHVKVDTRDTAPQWLVVPKLTDVNRPYHGSKSHTTGLQCFWPVETRDGRQHATRADEYAERPYNIRRRQRHADITEIAPGMAAIASGTDLVNAWPRALKYQRSPNLNTSGSAQDLDVVLDNLRSRPSAHWMRGLTT